MYETTSQDGPATYHHHHHTCDQNSIQVVDSHSAFVVPAMVVIVFFPHSLAAVDTTRGRSFGPP